MSGGSYEYASDTRSIQDLSQHICELKRMVFDLKTYHAEDVSADTEELIRYFEQLEDEFIERIKPLQKVWHALEWFKSGDWGEDGLQEAIEEYRNHKST